MTLSILTLSPQTLGADNAIFYSEGFRAVLEDALTWLINNANTTAVTIDPGTAYRYEADFFGLCNSLNIPQQLHWLVMRMAGFTMPTESDRNLSVIYKPDMTIVNQLLSLYTTNPT